MNGYNKKEIIVTFIILKGEKCNLNVSQSEPFRLWQNMSSQISTWIWKQEFQK